MPAVTTERELAAACRETLRQWPQARAAVLFGSRARGTAQPDSDWDVAIVLEGGELRHPRPAQSVFPRSELPADLPHVDVWALSEDDLRRNARALGTLSYVVCRDGRVLAGEWNPPDPVQIQHEAAMKPEDWARRMDLVLTKVHGAATSINAMSMNRTWTASASDCINLVQHSADAVELLVKAAMERRGVPADRTHNIARLAEALAAQRPDESILAERLAGLNGASRVHHIAMYEFHPPEAPDVRAAIRRLAGTLDLWALEVEMPGDEMAAYAKRLAQSGADRAETWHRLVRAPVSPKMDEDRAAQSSAEAAFALLPEIADTTAAFRERIWRVLEGPAPS